MAEASLWVIALVAVTVVTIMISTRLKIAYPIGLVIVGLLVCLVPGTPRVEVDPELIFVIFLPPLLYESGWAISWKELWRWRRIVGSFAFLVVFLSAAAVAFVSNLIFPGFSLALGFLLGGVVSSPDAVSTAAIMRFVKVPKRLSTILEGESLLNDASSLIIFRFATIAVTTGQFVFYQAAGQFLWMVFGGIGIGVLFGYLALKLHRYLPTDANTDIVMTLMTPYLMYIVAELVGASGVMAGVCGGLYTAYHGRGGFSASTRIRALSVWDSLVFILNGLTFILVGLELPHILSEMQADGVSIYMATGYGLAITLVLIIVRYIAVGGAILTTQAMKHIIQVADDRMPGWRMPVVFGWAGMRGAVSLAAALSIPLMAGSEPFPHRSLIIYVTFVVIFVTLVVQGLTLPILIKKVGLKEDNDHLPEAETEVLLMQELAKSSLTFVKEHFPDKRTGQYRLQELENYWTFLLEHGYSPTNEEGEAIYRAIWKHQREVLYRLNKRPEIDEKVVRQLAWEIDLEEDKLG